MKKPVFRIISLALVFILFFCGCSKAEKPETVARVNGYEVSREELMSYAWRFISEVDSENTLTADSFDRVLDENGTTLSKIIRDGALEYLLINRFFAEKADELGVSLDETDKAKLESDLEELVKSYGGEQNYEQDLAKSGMTASSNKAVYLADLLSNKVRDRLFGEGGLYAPSDTDLEDYYKWNYVTVSHILKLCRDMATGEDYPEEKQAEALETAKSAIERYNSGEDFIELAEELGEDGGLLSEPTRTYTFTYGEMAEEFETASFALNEGEVTPEPVRTAYGYHVIRKYPLDGEYFKSNLEAIKSSYARDECGALYDDWKGSATIEYTPAYDGIDLKQYY